MERVFILDVSGSMNSCLSDTLGGFDAFVKDQKDIGGTLSLYFFNDTLNEQYTNKPIDEVVPLSFIPQGGTAIYDAIGTVLTSHPLSNTSTVIILTDGSENTSRIYTRQAVRDLIKMKEAEGVRFMFLGAHEDAFEGADDIGLSRRDIMNYRAVNESPSAFISLTRCLRARSQGVETPLSGSNTMQTKPMQDMDTANDPETQVV